MIDRLPLLRSGSLPICTPALVVRYGQAAVRASERGSALLKHAHEIKIKSGLERVGHDVESLRAQSAGLLDYANPLLIFLGLRFSVRFAARMPRRPSLSITTKRKGQNPARAAVIGGGAREQRQYWVSVARSEGNYVAFPGQLPFQWKISNGPLEYIRGFTRAMYPYIMRLVSSKR
jgi:hypothetical protein